MIQFALFAVAGLVFFWAMAVSWSVSAGPVSIAPIISMLLASLLAATSGVWLFHRKAAAIVALGLLSFFVVWPPVAFVVHGASVGDAIFYGVVLALLAVPLRVLLRPTAESSPLSKRQLALHGALAFIPLALSSMLSIGLWSLVVNPDFWDKVASHPDLWGLKTK